MDRVKQLIEDSKLSKVPSVFEIIGGDKETYQKCPSLRLAIEKFRSKITIMRESALINLGDSRTNLQESINALSGCSEDETTQAMYNVMKSIEDVKDCRSCASDLDVLYNALFSVLDEK